jgi:hypothetical protein
MEPQGLDFKILNTLTDIFIRRNGMIIEYLILGLTALDPIIWTA